jgi:flagellum-specific peptidoglycan hydrolase FlgJ
MLGDGPEADLLTAQIALETAGGKSSYGYNLGNMKPRDAAGEKYQILTTHEGGKGNSVQLNEPFLAFDSLEDGLRAYVEYQDRKGHLDAAATGDVAAFNRSLKSKGYYTADEEDYLRLLQSRLKALSTNG